MKQLKHFGIRIDQHTKNKVIKEFYCSKCEKGFLAESSSAGLKSWPNTIYCPICNKAKYVVQKGHPFSPE